MPARKRRKITKSVVYDDDKYKGIAYQHLYKLKQNSLNRFLNGLDFGSIESYYNENVCVDYAMYEDDKDESVKKIIFVVQCQAHKMLFDLNVKRKKKNALLKREKDKFINLVKWKLQILSEYFLIEIKKSYNKNKLIELITAFFIQMKKEHDIDQLFNMKKYVHYLGENLKNLSVTIDSVVYMKIDGECYNWTQLQRNSIRSLFHTCDGRKTVPQELINGGDNGSCILNREYRDNYNCYDNLLVFIESLKIGQPVRGLQDPNAFRVACKVKLERHNWFDIHI